MNKPQTLDELKDILKSERDACLAGKTTYKILDPDLRKMMDEKFGDNPLYRQIALDGIGQIWAYHDFRDLIIEYQVENQISAIEWRSVKLGDRVITYPDTAMELESLPSDIELMRQHKDAIVSAWAEYIRSNSLHLWTEENDDSWVHVTLEDALRFADDCEWATVSDYGRGRAEVAICLGWGNPSEAGYIAHQEESGNLYITSGDSKDWFEGYKPVYGCPVVVRGQHNA